MPNGGCFTFACQIYSETTTKKTNLTETTHNTISSHLLRRIRINRLPCSYISTWTQPSKKRSDAFSCRMVVVSPLLVSSDLQFYSYCLPLHLQILASGSLFCVIAMLLKITVGLPAVEYYDCSWFDPPFNQRQQSSFVSFVHCHHKTFPTLLLDSTRHPLSFHVMALMIFSLSKLAFINLDNISFPAYFLTPAFACFSWRRLCCLTA